MFVSFASLVVYTFSIFLKPLSAAFGWSRGQVSFAFGMVVAAAVLFVSPRYKAPGDNLSSALS